MEVLPFNLLRVASHSAHVSLVAEKSANQSMGANDILTIQVRGYQRYHRQRLTMSHLTRDTSQHLMDGVIVCKLSHLEEINGPFRSECLGVR